MQDNAPKGEFSKLIAGTLLAGAVFLLLPARLGFVRELPPEPYTAWFALMFRLDAPHNLVPSLHVVFSGLIALACADVARPWVRRVLYGWLALIGASTVLDVAAGFAVALADALISLRLRPRSGAACARLAAHESASWTKSKPPLQPSGCGPGPGGAGRTPHHSRR